MKIPVSELIRTKERRQFLAYESARNAGCQMLTDAVAFFPNRLEAVTALRQILECNQSAIENHAASNWLNTPMNNNEHNALPSQAVRYALPRLPP